MHVVNMTGSITISFTGVVASATRTYTAVVAIRQSSAGGGTVTWPAACVTPDNINFTQSATANAVDIYTVFTYNGGASYILTQIGQGYA